MMCASVGRTRARAAAAARASASVSMPSGSQLDRVHARAALAQRQQRAVVGRALDDHLVARAHELLEQERVRLHRAVGDEHPLGLDAVAVGDPAAQPRVADRGAVGGRARRVALERAHGRVAQPVDVDDVERRGAAREGDRGSGGALAQRRSLGVRAARRSHGSARAPPARGDRESAAAPPRLGGWGERACRRRRCGAARRPVGARSGGAPAGGGGARRAGGSARAGESAGARARSSRRRSGSRRGAPAGSSFAALGLRAGCAG